VLARTFENAGMSTVVVTNMPYWAARIGLPRTLGVEFPFGHTLGQPHNVAMQRRVIRAALQLLEQAQAPGSVVNFPEKWPAPLEEARRISHPTIPPPISAEMGKYIGKFLLGLRRSPG
jgi:hypothetical protein